MPHLRHGVHRRACDERRGDADPLPGGARGRRTGVVGSVGDGHRQGARGTAGGRWWLLWWRGLRLMGQPTSLDAQFLALETPRQTGHVAGLAIYDTASAPGGRLTCAEMKDLISSRLHLLPPL